MQVPKAAQVAFDGEVPFSFSMAQVELLLSSRGFSRGEHLAKARSGGEDIAATASDPTIAS
jgi:hypothetical protein